MISHLQADSPLFKMLDVEKILSAKKNILLVNISTENFASRLLLNLLNQVL